MRKTFDQIAEKYPEYAEHFAAIKPFYMKGEEFEFLTVFRVILQPAKICMAVSLLVREGLLKQSYGFVLDGKLKAGRWDTPLEIPHEMLGCEDRGKSDLLIFLTPQGEYIKK